MIVCSTGMTQHAAKADNLKTLMDLAMMTGHVGRHSTGVNPSWTRTTPWAHATWGLCRRCSQDTRSEGPRDPEEVRGPLGCHGPDRQAGSDLLRMVEAAHAGSLKCLYVMGENPLPDGQDPTRVEHAWRISNSWWYRIYPHRDRRPGRRSSARGLVAEKDGTYTSTERRVQLARKALDPPGRPVRTGRSSQNCCPGWAFPASTRTPNRSSRRSAPRRLHTQHHLSQAGRGTRAAVPCPTEEHPAPRSSTGTVSPGTGVASFPATSCRPRKTLTRNMT
jgi:hypothetical protein